MEKYVGLIVGTVIIIAFAVIMWRGYKNNKAYWSETNKAIGVLDDSHRLLLVGAMGGATKEVSRKNTKREVAVAINENGISIFDLIDGCDENSNFKRVAIIEKENIEKIAFSIDETNRKLFLLNVLIKNPIKELQMEDKKDFHFALSVYDSSVLFSDIKSVINNYTK